MSNDESLEDISRREFIKKMTFGWIRTIALTGYHVFAVKYVSLYKRLQIAESKVHEESSRVQEFAEDILDTAYRTVGTIGKAKYTLMMPSAYFLGDALGGYLLRGYSKLANRNIGLSSAVIGRVVDIASTFATLRAIKDPRFKEYGLDDFIFELNTQTSPHPSPYQVIEDTALQSGAICAASWIFPFLGRGYLTVSPLIAANNVTVASLIYHALDIGDKVKKLVKDGKNDKEIKEFLRQYGGSEK